MFELKKIGKLTEKIGKYPLRTVVVKGVPYCGLPEVGRSFIIIGKSLTPGLTGRMVATSTVTGVEEKEGVITFRTINSIYELRKIKNDHSGN
jgi:hypothetical protein